MPERGTGPGDERSLLAYEGDPLVCERLRLLARDAGWRSCIVDSAALFHELRVRIGFERLVVGAPSPQALDELKLERDVAPLALLVPLASPGGAAHYAVALPEATLLDRDLRDPAALAAWLGGRSPRAGAGATGEDPVRQAFEPFGLSERQLEVLQGALLGDSTAEIATRLFISQLTVRNHLHAIYERVGVSGRRELLGRFVRGLLDR